MKILRHLFFWILALLLTLGMARYQRKTGPTHPITGAIELENKMLDYILLRSHGGEGDHLVTIAVPDSSFSGTLYWKRLGLNEPMNEIAMAFNREAVLPSGSHSTSVEHGSALVAALPHQPPAGKLEYHLVLTHGVHSIGLPESGENAVIRFKGEVPIKVLIPHIFFMFFAMFLATRTGLAALLNDRTKKLAITTFLFLAVGGLILGPIVQKHAFDAYWTGWPFGGDLTDNKTLLAIVAWLLALWKVLTERKRNTSRWWLVAATAVLLGVYSIPHSMGGSTFNYETGQVDTGLQTEQP